MTLDLPFIILMLVDFEEQHSDPQYIFIIALSNPKRPHIQISMYKYIILQKYYCQHVDL